MSREVSICITHVSVSCESVRLAFSNPGKLVDPETPKIYTEEEAPPEVILYLDKHVPHIGKGLSYCVEDSDTGEYECYNIDKALDKCGIRKNNEGETHD